MTSCVISHGEVMVIMFSMIPISFGILLFPDFYYAVIPIGAILGILAVSLFVRVSKSNIYYFRDAPR
jgi:hypothetical protein